MISNDLLLKTSFPRHAETRTTSHRRQTVQMRELWKKVHRQGQFEKTLKKRESVFWEDWAGG